MHELILLINSYSGIIAIAALFIIIVTLLVKRFGKKPLNEWMAKIIKPAVYVLLAAGFIHMVFSIRLAMK